MSDLHSQREFQESNSPRTQRRFIGLNQRLAITALAASVIGFVAARLTNSQYSGNSSVVDTPQWTMSITFDLLLWFTAGGLALTCTIWLTVRLWNEYRWTQAVTGFTLVWTAATVVCAFVLVAAPYATREAYAQSVAGSSANDYAPIAQQLNTVASIIAIAILGLLLVTTESSQRVREAREEAQAARVMATVGPTNNIAIAGYNPRTNSMAVAALVLGIVIAPLTIPVGHIARSQIKRTGEQGNGLALAGLILGYIFLSLIVLFLAAIVFGSA